MKASKDLSNYVKWQMKGLIMLSEFFSMSLFIPKGSLRLLSSEYICLIFLEVYTPSRIGIFISRITRETGCFVSFKFDSLSIFSIAWITYRPFEKGWNLPVRLVCEEITILIASLLTN